MTKRRKKSAPAEDYLNQLQWKADRSPSRFTSKDPFEPSWKFRIIQKYQGNPVLSLLSAIVIFGAIGLGFFTLYQKYLATGSSYTLAILVFFTVFVVMVLAALLDTKRKS